MIAEKDPYIKSAYDQLQIISQDKQKRLEYEAREKAIRDHNQMIFEAEQRGERRGEQRGEMNKALKIAKNLINLGYDTVKIKQITDLPAEQIDELRTTLRALGTVKKLNEQVTKNVFPSAKKKT